MKEKKVSLVTYVISLIIMLVVVVSIMVAIFNQKQNKGQENKVQKNLVKEHSSTQTKEKGVGNDVSYVGIQIEDESKGELTYTDPLIIKDEQVINNLKNIINNGEAWTNVDEELGEGGYFEASPIITFYLSNGNKVYLLARDNMKDDINVFAIYYKEDASDKTIYKTETNIEEYALNLYKKNSVTQSVTNSVAQDDFFIVYNGREIQKDIGVKQTSDMETSENNKKKYNIKYYNYENGQYKGETKGIFGKEETYEGQSIVSNVSKIAISKKYNAIPRNITKMKVIPEELKNEKMYPVQVLHSSTGESVSVNFEDLKVKSVDLDGDNKLEYIVCWNLDIEEGEYEDSHAESSSGIILFDNTFNKISQLVSIKQEFKNNQDKKDKKEENFVFDIDDVECIDIDNDGKMEVLIELPSWEGFKYSLLKYDNGKIEGKVDYKASIEP